MAHLKLMDDFQEYVPVSGWISSEDLDTMWLLGKEGKSYYGVTKKRKRIRNPVNANKAMKVVLLHQKLQSCKLLTSLYSSKYTIPQYRLWAKFIQSKRHDSYDTPPNIPLITGTPDTRKRDKKDTVSDAIAGAATAFAKALNGSPTGCKIPSQGISPNSHATLRRKHLEDMQMLEDGILSTDEYREQKENILSILCGLAN